MKLFIADKLFDGEKLLSSRALAVENGLIVWAGDKEEAKRLFSADEEIACAFLMPGLIDCHVHLAILDREPESPAEWGLKALEGVRNLKELLKAGVVACRDLGSTGGISIAIEQAQRAGVLTGLPHLTACGRALCATGGHGWDISLECDGGDGFRKGCRTVIKEGARVVKVMMSGGVNSPGEEPGPPEVTQKEIETVVEEAHARGKKVAVHAHGNTAIRRSVWAGVDSVEHGVFNSPDIMAEMARRGTYLVPTLSAPYWATVEGIRREPDNPDHQKSRAVVEGHNRATLNAFQAGVPIAMGTDAGCPFNPYDNACFEAVLLSRAGIPAEKVLHICTAGGAELMGLNKLGYLREGMEASFAALDASPLENMEAICGAKRVWIQGKREV